MESSNADSILVTIKKMLGLGEDYTPFDKDIIVLINGALSTLTQLGVGPEEGFSISGYQEEWPDFTDLTGKLSFVKTYVFLNVKTVFDPPSSAYVLEAYNKQIKELEWRIAVAVDPGEEELDA